MNYNEAYSLALRMWKKAGRRLFIAFVCVCVGTLFVLLLYVFKAHKFVYFLAGVIYSVIQEFIMRATESWRKG